MIAVMFSLLDNINADIPLPANYTPDCQAQTPGVYGNLCNNRLGDGALREADVVFNTFMGTCEYWEFRGNLEHL
jgi:hypothetical protein